jgi:hypothetical protein
MTEIETLISGFSAVEMDRAAAPLPRELRPVVQALLPAHRPSTVCATCPDSLWLKSATELRCYCRPMHLIVYSTAEPTELLDCDQLHRSTEESE